MPESLLDAALSEITRRVPDYFARCTLTIPPVDVLVAKYCSMLLWRDTPAHEVAAALHAGLEYLRQRGVSFATDAAERNCDPVSEVLLRSIMDALAVRQGRLDLHAQAPLPNPTELAQSERYSERRTAEGVRYRIGRRGERTLLVVNALGMPLALWSNLLGDTTLPVRVLAVECASTELDQGGMQAVSDLATEAARIVSVFDHAHIESAAVIAWCSGARLALELAATSPKRVSSITLVCPTLRGVEGVTPLGSAFEDDLNRIFVSIAKQPSLTTAVANAFAQRVHSSTWDEVNKVAAQRATRVLSLPARDRAVAISLPLTKPADLACYAERVLRDQTHPVRERLAGLQAPVLLMTADHDDRVKNEFTRAALHAGGRSFVELQMQGAGHYIYDLQYPYLRMSLCEFLAGRPLAEATRLSLIPT